MTWSRHPIVLPLDLPATLLIAEQVTYSDIKGESTAKNTDASIFDAILRIY